jgi:hypothetical protein
MNIYSVAYLSMVSLLLSLQIKVVQQYFERQVSRRLGVIW